jgi:hypothetical protein
MVYQANKSPVYEVISVWNKNASAIRSIEVTHQINDKATCEAINKKLNEIMDIIKGA